MKKLFSTALAITVAASLLLTGCGSKTQEPAASVGAGDAKKVDTNKKVSIRVAWWGSQVRNERTEKVFKMYSEKNSNVSFEPEAVAWDGYWDKLATQTAASNLPDVIQHDYAYIGQYVEKKILEDLTPYTKSGEINVKDIAQGVIDSGSIGGKLYALSLGTNAHALVYDPEAFKKAGVAVPNKDWTWKDFDENIAKVAKATGMPSEPPFFSGIKNMLIHVVKQTGKPYFKEDGTGLGFTDEAVLVEMFERALRNTKAGVYPKPDTLVSVKTVEDTPLAKNSAFLGGAWSNQFVALQSAAKKPLELSIPPQGGTKPGIYLKPSQFFTISGKSALKVESAKFIDYFTNDIEANKVLLGERGVPVSSKVRDAIKAQLDDSNKKIFDYIALAEKNVGPIDPPEPPGSGEVDKSLRNLYSEVVFGKTAPAAAAKQFIKEANEILAKNKK